MQVKTNLQVLKRSNRPPQPGDVFAMKLPTGKYLFGTVLLADVPRDRAPMPGANLLYIYERQSDTRQPDYADLQPNRLLLAPLWTNRLAWTKGYFETVSNRALSRSDLVKQHCFYRAATEKFVDETGAVLERRSDPCGQWGLVSYRWIDDHVSDAVGIPRAPEE